MKVDKKNTPSVSQRFKAVREQLGFTQQELANEMLLTRNYIAKIEADIQVPSPRALMALEALRVSLIHKREQAAALADPAAHFAGGAPDKRTATELARALRAEFEVLLAASGQLPQRLHWVGEQMKEHLAIPQSWRKGAKGGHVSLPSQTAALSAETGKPLPAASRPARSA